MRSVRQVADAIAGRGGSSAAAPSPRDLGRMHRLSWLGESITSKGKELVLPSLRSEIAHRIDVGTSLASLFPEVEMPTADFWLPAAGVGRVRSGVRAEAQTVKPVELVVSRAQLSAVMFACKLLVSAELADDVTVSLYDWVLAEVGDFFRADVSAAILDGDTATPHQDSDVTGDDPRKSWDGLRKLAPVRINGGNVPLSSALLVDARRQMGVYGARPDALAHIVGMSGYRQLLADAAFVSIEKYGAATTLLDSEVGRVNGVPVIVTELVREDLNASGVFAGATANRSYALTVHRRGFVYGVRPAFGRGAQPGDTVDVWTQSEMHLDVGLIGYVYAIRRAFAAVFPAGQPSASLIYNLSTA